MHDCLYVPKKEILRFLFWVELKNWCTNKLEIFVGICSSVFFEISKLRVCVGKTENHRGTTTLLTRTFSMILRTYQMMKILLFQFWVKSKDMVEAHISIMVAISPSVFFT